jgi:hypothetical protein
VPPFSGAPAPQREQVTQRLRHRSHTGVPVAREMPIRPLPADPQMLQATAGPGRQLWQTGPAGVSAATRRGFPHIAQGFQLRGSRCQQFWQSPSTGTPSCRCLPQRGQGGSATAVAPARASALMNRRTPGSGAGALTGEQLGLACHGGCEAAPSVPARRGLVQCPEDRFRAERGLQLRHQGE